MIRGSIEIVRRTQISGWIHAEAGGVRDRLILAFAGERCVGAGKVDRFRKDLLDAKLGDGYCGFDFPIRLDDEEKLGALTVRLQNSDAALIQRTTRLVGPDDIASSTDLGAVPPECVGWMQDRGWLAPSESAFLKAVQTIGAFEYAMTPMLQPTGKPGPAQAARFLLSLYAMSAVTMTTSRIAALAQLTGSAVPLSAQNLSLLALWSAEPCRIALDERSHIEGARHTDDIVCRVTDRPAPGAIEYCFGPDTVLFLHRHASFAADGAPPAGGITVFTASSRNAASIGEDQVPARAAVAA